MNAKMMLNKAWFGLKKSSPTIAVISGIGAGIFGTVLACKATTKLDKVLDDKTKKMQKVHEDEKNLLADPSLQKPEDQKQIKIYTERKIVKIWGMTIFDLVKLFGPAVAAWIVAIFLILYSHISMKKRITALGALCLAYGKSMADYRAMVAEMYGEEKERDIYYGLHNEKIEEVVVDEETGKETKQKVAAKVIDETKVVSPYAVFFDKSNPNYIKDDPVFNYDFICDVQKTLNVILQTRGWVFLNDARTALGYKPIPEGQILGWVWDDKEDCPFDSDNPKIDLGIGHIGRQEVRDFKCGYEKVFIIDFNCDPIIDDFYLFDKSNRIA